MPEPKQAPWRWAVTRSAHRGDGPAGALLQPHEVGGGRVGEGPELVEVAARAERRGRRRAGGTATIEGSAPDEPEGVHQRVPHGAVQGVAHLGTGRATTVQLVAVPTHRHRWAVVGPCASPAGRRARRRTRGRPGGSSRPPTRRRARRRSAGPPHRAAAARTPPRRSAAPSPSPTTASTAWSPARQHQVAARRRRGGARARARAVRPTTTTTGHGARAARAAASVPSCRHRGSTTEDATGARRRPTVPSVRLAAEHREPRSSGTSSSGIQRDHCRAVADDDTCGTERRGRRRAAMALTGRPDGPPLGPPPGSWSSAAGSACGADLAGTGGARPRPAAAAGRAGRARRACAGRRRRAAAAPPGCVPRGRRLGGRCPWPGRTTSSWSPRWSRCDVGPRPVGGRRRPARPRPCRPRRSSNGRALLGLPAAALPRPRTGAGRDAGRRRSRGRRPRRPRRARPAGRPRSSTSARCGPDRCAGAPRWRPPAPTVVKVESTRTARRRPHGARPPFFDLLNAGKRSVALDLTLRRRAPALLRRCWPRADVVIEASRPRALRQLGIDAERRARRGRAAGLGVDHRPRAGRAGCGLGRLRRRRRGGRRARGLRRRAARPSAPTPSPTR